MKKHLILTITLLLVAMTAHAGSIIMDVGLGTIYTNNPQTINAVGPGVANLTSVTVQFLAGTLNSAGWAQETVPPPTLANFDVTGFQFGLSNFTGQGAMAIGPFTAPDRHDSGLTPIFFSTVTTNAGPSGILNASNPGALNGGFTFVVDKDTLQATLTCPFGNCNLSVSTWITGTVRFVYNYADTQVPEPGTFALLGSALVGLGALARRRHTK